MFEAKYIHAFAFVMFVVDMQSLIPLIQDLMFHSSVIRLHGFISTRSPEQAHIIRHIFNNVKLFFPQSRLTAKLTDIHGCT